MRLLLAEDQRDLNRSITRALTAAHYSVDCAFDGAEALDYLAAAEYDAAVLDVMMPRKTGLEVLTALRARGDRTPVLLLTALDGIHDRVTGLDAGADDYLVKPFAMDELLARLRALTRRSIGAPSNVYTVADLTVDTAAHTASRGGTELKLSAREYELLALLIRHHGAVLSRRQIEDSLWNFDYSGGTNVVDVYISYLRKKVDSGHEKKLIHTVRGLGWTLREETEGDA